MTATEMATNFLLQLNMTNTNQVLSWEVARFLNQAQDYYYYAALTKMQPPTNGRQPAANNPDDITSQQDLIFPFIKTIDVVTNVKGAFVMPADLNKIESVLVWVPNKCDTGNLLPVTEMTENQLGNTLNDAFAAPKLRSKQAHNFLADDVYYLRTNINGTRAIRIYPQGVHDVRFTYFRQPAAIAINNTSPSSPFYSETVLYSTNPKYIATSADANCEFPAMYHKSIVERALAQFSLSVPDYAQYGAENARAAAE